MRDDKPGMGWGMGMGMLAFYAVYRFSLVSAQSPLPENYRLKAVLSPVTPTRIHRSRRHRNSVFSNLRLSSVFRRQPHLGILLSSTFYSLRPYLFASCSSVCAQDTHAETCKTAKREKHALNPSLLFLAPRKSKLLSPSPSLPVPLP